MPQINEAGLALIEKFEGCLLYAYDDFNDNRIEPGDVIQGTLTIGYGHTGPDVVPGKTITQEQAVALLKEDVHSAEAAVADAVEVVLTPNQFSALVSFEYNTGAFAGSTLCALINQNDFAGAADQFGAWVYGNGQELPGLVARRAAEKELFLTA